MTQQSLNLGSNANDGSGDDLRSAMTKVQANFTDLYTNVNELLGETAVNSQISFAGNKISTNVSNADLVLEASGTGDIILDSVTIHDNEISSNRTNDNLYITANGTGSLQLHSENDIEFTAKDDLHLAPDSNVILAPLQGEDIYHYLLNGSKAVFEQHGTGSWEVLHVASGVNSYLGTGTAAFPTSNEDLWRLSISGHNTTANYSSFGSGGQLKFMAGEQWSGGSHGTLFKIQTTISGATAPQDRISVDVNGHVTIGTLKIDTNGTISSLNSDQNITLSPAGSGVVAIDGVSISGNKIRTNATNSNLELYGSGTGKVSFYQAYTLPTTDGSSNQILKTDGAGALSWTTISGASLSNSASSDSSTTVTGSAMTTIDTFDPEIYRSGEYLITVSARETGDSTLGGTIFETHKLLVMHDRQTQAGEPGDIYFTQNSIKNHAGTDICSFTMDMPGTDVRLRATAGGANIITYKIHRNLINV